MRYPPSVNCLWVEDHVGQARADDAALSRAVSRGKGNLVVVVGYGRVGRADVLICCSTSGGGHASPLDGGAGAAAGAYRGTTKEKEKNKELEFEKVKGTCNPADLMTKYVNQEVKSWSASGVVV